MTTPVLFPKFGFSMNVATIADWLHKDGAAVPEGQPLYALESDKAVQEIEAPASGTVKILATVGEVYQVGAVLAEIN